ncbi:hypothetical protein [Rhodanobacter glycinis]|mgnify:FL=1|jgi:hypothetical protein|uniref:Uncharacterized protein n=1 Tax=Rhodanobacter glycinis TaxID=582702 RepID=A0A1I4GD26_9GAMM|nr:hypothetical protein [Rhodanobacter glycinis]SFL27935.1 hypothetical protein SAMN05192579_1243 [Rhodanobacter glycinis]
MKVFESALLLVVGTALLTFSAISLGLFPRPLTLSNPTLFVEALAIAGLVLFGLGVRGLYRVHRVISGNSSYAPSRSAAA